MTENCSETAYSLEQQDLAYLIRLNEYIDSQNYVTSVYQEEEKRKIEQSRQNK